VTEPLAFEDAAAFDAWLADHHAARADVWVKIAKKGSGVASVTADEAGAVALCHGWIDSVRRSLDETYFLQRYSPRRPQGSWSRVNVERVEALIAAGRMRPAGLAEVEAAKADGRWDAAYVSQRDATVPPDLAEALARNVKAKERFESLGRTDRYLVILQLLKARTPASREATLRKAVTALEAGQKP
jgi:uncharacterized protein YdeI (YjbR/CyaY-like superfamily)